MRKQFEFDGGVAVGNDNVTIALHKGPPSLKTIGHMSFHLPNMSILRKALAHLQKVGVDLEDPGHENCKKFLTLNMGDSLTTSVAMTWGRD